MENSKTQVLLDKLKDIKEIGKKKWGHVEADRALLAYIDEDKVTDAFNDIDKWYA